MTLDDGWTLDNRWVTADGTLNELPITIHYREDWQATAHSGRFPICIQIAWQGVTRDDKCSYPAQQEMQQIEVFHHQLQQQTEQEGHGIVAMVLTHDGLNQWVLYCDDIAKISKGLDQIVAPARGFPIEIVADEDAQWQTFKKVHQVIQ